MSAFWSHMARTGIGESSSSNQLGSIAPPPAGFQGSSGALSWVLRGAAQKELNKGNVLDPGKEDTITRSILALEEMNSAMRSMERRAMVAFTTSGYFVWTHGEAVRETDIVCILLGCSYPVILRPRGDYFEIVSECYIDQYMSGEALELLGEDAVELETFSIC
ncbi:hypothetical protein K469DRAFT_366276 [Zopfia rhizophila CBS 207.26]|uniref:Heterokaryon incompatibility domain-containing protein n=1 Tax=Zopfia rhizophila CBS 207.26 TaxID=1314779 RepID=A0A6A6EKA6_9PEZI|nr:hypothetical protein K469DRAFT_366276 [Zopfia rhizophila CBS 207.26]